MEDLESIGTPQNKMPELPEVETVKNVLNSIVPNCTIKSIDVIRKQNIVGDSNKFVKELTNESFKNVSRIGKYLIFHLTNNKVIISHLRMDGKYYEYDESDLDSKYPKVIFHLSNNKKLIYDDSRGFGQLKLSSESSYLKEKELAKIGPEPFQVDPKYLCEKNKNNNAPIKTVILDQSLMTGLGNIYADETLYMTHIHPHTPARLLSLNTWERLVFNACIILNKAIKAGGSTIKSYHPGKDIDGNFQNELLAYGKKGTLCHNCGHEFLFTKTNGRGTTFCPHCQIKRGTPINVGLTGPIGSGKSSFLIRMKEEGCDTISCDEIVAKLYKEEKVTNLIEQSLHIKLGKTVDKKKLKNHLLVNPQDFKKVERIIFPLVIEKVNNFLKHSKADIRVVEAPLLFKAHMENMFDTIILIDVNEEKQMELLYIREGNHASLSKQINKNNAIEENKNKAEFLVYNDSSLEEFNRKATDIVNILKSRLN